MARQPVERHVAPPLPRGIGELAQELRIDAEEPASFRIPAKAIAERLDPSILEAHRHGSPVLDAVGIGERTEIDLEDRPVHAIPTWVGRTLRGALIVGAFEETLEGGRLERVPDPVVLPVGIDARREFPSLPHVARRSDRGEPEPVVPEEAERDRREEDEPAKRSGRGPRRTPGRP